MDLKQNYFSVHNHSSFSNALLGFPDSTNTIKDMLEYAGKAGLSGLVLSDHEGLSGFVELLDAEKELKEKEIISRDFKVGIGDEIYLRHDRGKEGRFYHHLLLAKDIKGFEALKEISSNAWDKSYYAKGLLRRPTLFSELKEFVEKYKGHLISSSACFLRGTKIITDKGFKNIEDIKTGDKVLNKNGVFEDVNYPTSRKFHGKGYKIKTIANSNSISCTDNHKFLVEGKDWVRADELKTTDILLEALPQFKFTNEQTNVEEAMDLGKWILENQQPIPWSKLNISHEFNKILLASLMDKKFETNSYLLAYQVSQLLNMYAGGSIFSSEGDKYIISSFIPDNIKSSENGKERVLEQVKIFDKVLEENSQNYTEDKKYIRRPIQSIEEIEINEYVYCLNNNSHSFHAEHVVVHNCLGGYLGQHILAMVRAKTDEDIYNAKKEIDWFIKYNLELFGEDFYLEVQPSASEEQAIVNTWLKKLGQAYNIKLIFSTDSHYLNKDEAKSHEIFLKSKNAERETADFYSGTFVQTIEEVRNFLGEDFSDEDINMMVENTLEIRDKIKDYNEAFIPQQIPLVEVNPPELKISEESQELIKNKENIQTMVHDSEPQTLYWINTCLNELERLNIFDENHVKSLEYEASVMVGCTKKFNQPMSAYYNTTQSLINMMWDECNTLVGPSRGSALGYVSNYLLGICQIDPVPYPMVQPWRHLSVLRPDLPKIILGK